MYIQLTTMFEHFIECCVETVKLLRENVWTVGSKVCVMKFFYMWCCLLNR